MTPRVYVAAPYERGARLPRMFAVRGRKALHGPGCLTHREIAALLGLSPARVQQIERQALRKLARLLAEKNVTREDLP